jgi:hypothetical protein
MDSGEGNSEERIRDRRSARFPCAAQTTIRSNDELLTDQTVDISESGMSAFLPVRLQVGQTVEPKIELPGALAAVGLSCETEMAFVMALSFCNRCMMSSAIKQPTTARTAPVQVTYCKPWTGGRGIAFMRTRCPECGGMGRNSNPSSV